MTAVDAAVGAIPVVGSVFDFWFKANNRNVALLERYGVDPEGTVESTLLLICGSAGTVGAVTRYTPPSDHDEASPYQRRPLYMRIGVWVLLIGVLALVFVDVLAAFI